MAKKKKKSTTIPKKIQPAMRVSDKLTIHVNQVVRGEERLELKYTFVAGYTTNIGQHGTTGIGTKTELMNMISGWIDNILDKEVKKVEDVIEDGDKTSDRGIYIDYVLSRLVGGSVFKYQMGTLQILSNETVGTGITNITNTFQVMTPMDVDFESYISGDDIYLKSTVSNETYPVIMKYRLRRIDKNGI